VSTFFLELDLPGKTKRVADKCEAVVFWCENPVD